MAVGPEREVVVDGLTFRIIEIPMDEEWPAGDPVARDKETLVVFTYRPTEDNE